MPKPRGVFEPETTAAMKRVYERAVSVLVVSGLAAGELGAARKNKVAKAIVELAKIYEFDEQRLQEETLLLVAVKSRAAA